MARIKILLIGFFLLTLISAHSQEEEMKEVRKAAVAGIFYPNTVQSLKEQIKRYLNMVKPLKIEGRIIALISPHAGYQFSGRVAAYGFKAIQARAISTVVIIGPSHYVYFQGSSVYPRGYYQTPLGEVEIDEKIAEKIINHSNIHFYPPAHQREHSVEVQIPFLQTILENFKIVPIVMGECSYQDCMDLGKAIAKAIGERKDVLIIASTDLSHFYTAEKAKGLDEITLKEIQKLNPEELYKKVKQEECELCGAMPVVATLIASKELGANKINLLKYLHSGEVSGDNSRVVGYASLVISQVDEEESESQDLSFSEKKRLLEVARNSIGVYLRKRERMEIKEANPRLLKKRGVFVTLKKNGNLRGCIGYIQPVKPLIEAVRDMAIEAAFNDPRFSPLQEKEMKEIEIEISVLSPLRRVEDIKEIKVGRDGLLIRKGFSSGLLLPQVATEYNWDREEFLMHTCYKAGLSPDAWREGAEIYTFTAEVFTEGEIEKDR